ncbi:MAG: Hydroperoxy fatty acid reductase 1 [Pseudomonadota bacterium]|jgi:glutathione peroxidase
MSIYDYSFTDNKGNLIELSKFKDNLLLIVNVASNCGFTEQYKGLQELHKKYADKGLVVIGFPCNQFGNQEPGSNEEIKNFCETRYGVDFIISEKIDVNGENAHPLFKYLVSKADFDAVPWNFTKFLVDKNQFRSMSPNVTPEQIDEWVPSLLN